jgi:hypothetical protein
VTPSGTTPPGPSDQFTYTGAGSAIVGLGLALAGGTPTPTVSCNYKGNGNNTCTLSGVGCGGSATFYAESVDGNGNPVAVTQAGGLQVTVGNGASPSRVTIPQGFFSTFANGQAVTAQLSPPTCGKGNGNNSESETVNLTAMINGGPVTLAVTVKS